MKLTQFVYIINSLNPVYLPITRRQILDSSKLKEFADDNLSQSYPNG